MDSPLKRTPLFDAHVAAGARMVPFGGWEMPVQYTGIIEEHLTVRSAVGLFDVSHMGEFEVTGAQALAALQVLTTNDVGALEIGQVQYSLLCVPDGGIVDDLTLYRLGAERFMLTVNAANIDKDWAWVTEQSRQFRGAAWRNISADTALIAVQGPKAEALVGRLADCDVAAIGYYRFRSGHVAGAQTVISRTGYTGEDGFELYLPARDAMRVWRALLDRGAADGVAPIGLGARDTLRLEMRYALYGNDIDETTNPIEAGLGGEGGQGGVHRARRDREGARRRAATQARGHRDGRPRGGPSRLSGRQGRPHAGRGHLRVVRPVGRQVDRARLRRGAARGRRCRPRRRHPRPGASRARGENAVSSVAGEEVKR